MSAFSQALALESIPDELKQYPKDALVRYAKTVAYKVFHNIKNGHEMDPTDDPITFNNKFANEVWKDHYK